MIRKDRKLRLQGLLFPCVVLVLLLFAMAAAGEAQEADPNYPTKPISCVIHSGPGTTNDIMTRLINDIIQKEKILNQPLVVLNKPGSGGGAAYGYVYERKGNPYLIMSVISGTFLTTPLTEKVPYNYKTFTPIANIGADGMFLVVRSDSPFKTIDDIIAAARKKPKDLIQGGSSFTGADNIMGQAMQKLKGVQWDFISFSGNFPEAVLNVLSGNVQFSFAYAPQVRDYIRTGKLRAILAAAPMGRYQSPEFKDTPTMKETGMGEPIVPYRGIVGTQNMPAYAAKKLEAVFKRVVDTDRFKKYFEDSMMQPAWMSSAEYSKFLDEENGRWKVRLTNVGLLKK